MKKFFFEDFEGVFEKEISSFTCLFFWFCKIDFFGVLMTYQNFEDLR